MKKGESITIVTNHPNIVYKGRIEFIEKAKSRSGEIYYTCDLYNKTFRFLEPPRNISIGDEIMFEEKNNIITLITHVNGVKHTPTQTNP